MKEAKIKDNVIVSVGNETECAIGPMLSALSTFFMRQHRLVVENSELRYLSGVKK